MPIIEDPTGKDKEVKQEYDSPFLSEKLFNTESNILEEWATGQTWYQYESPFLYAFEPKAQDVMIEPEVEEFQGRVPMDSPEMEEQESFDEELFLEGEYGILNGENCARVKYTLGEEEGFEYDVPALGAATADHSLKEIA